MAIEVKKSSQVSLQDKIQQWKNKFCKDCNDVEVEMFIAICERTGLDPVIRQIYAVKRSGNEPMTIITAIDGFRSIAESTGKYCPGRDSTYTYNNNNEIMSATSYVRKQTSDGTWHEVSYTCYFDEFAGRTKDGKLNRFWAKMPHVMLAKCAEASAIRKAFPKELGGVYAKEEIEESVDVPPKGWDIFSSEQKETILKAIGPDEDLYTKVDSFILDKNPSFESVMKRINLTKNPKEKEIIIDVA